MVFCFSLGFEDFLSSSTFPLGGIGSRGASSFPFLLWSPGVDSFPMNSCYSLGFGGFISSIDCLLKCIISRGASQVYFLLLSPIIFSFSVFSCSSLGFGYFLSSDTCPLGGIGSRGASRSFGIWSPSDFFPYMGCIGRWKFLSSAPFLFSSVFDGSDE